MRNRKLAADQLPSDSFTFKFDGYKDPGWDFCINISPVIYAILQNGLKEGNLKIMVCTPNGSGKLHFEKRLARALQLPYSRWDLLEQEALKRRQYNRDHPLTYRDLLDEEMADYLEYAQGYDLHQDLEGDDNQADPLEQTKEQVRRWLLHPAWLFQSQHLFQISVRNLLQADLFIILGFPLHKSGRSSCKESLSKQGRRMLQSFVMAKTQAAVLHFDDARDAAVWLASIEEGTWKTAF